MSSAGKDSDAIRREIMDLADAQLCDRLNDAGKLRLRQLVCDNTDARRHYVRFIHDCACFRELADGSELAVTTTPITAARSESWSDRASRRALLPSIAVATVATAVALIWTAVTYLPGVATKDNQHMPVAQAEFVAWYMGARDAEWLDGTEPEKTRLKLGQRLAIEKGLIEIQYRTGAEVVIEGPAEFYVGRKPSAISDQQSAKDEIARSSTLHPTFNSGYLALGKLVARVEGKDAKGFFVDTPSARIVDLGTEFGVAVNEDGAADIEVFEGDVRLKTSDGLTIVAISTGDAYQVRLDGTMLPLTNVARRVRFTQRMPRQERPESIVASVKPSLMQVNTLNNTSDVFFTPADDDLIDASQVTFSRRTDSGYTSYRGSSPANLHNGTVGASVTNADIAFDLDGTWTSTFFLNISTNTLGYEITQIDSYAGWSGANHGQKYELLYSTVGDASFTSLGTYVYFPATGGTKSTRIVLTDSTGKIATGVDALRFNFTNPGASGGDASAMREIDVVGSATVPTATAPESVTQATGTRKDLPPQRSGKEAPDMH